MTTLSLVLPIFVLAFVAAIAWTLGCALMITVSKHLEMRLLAYRMRLERELSLKNLKAIDAQQAKAETSAPQAVPQSARRWYHMSGEGGQA